MFKGEISLKPEYAVYSASSLNVVEQVVCEGLEVADELSWCYKLELKLCQDSALPSY